MASTYRSRLVQMHTKTSGDWWADSFAYPIARRLVAVFGDCKWITPNRITLNSALSLMLGSLLLALRDPRADWASVGVFQAYLILDCADGTLARYRKESSALGAFFDKAADQVGFLMLGAAVGYRAFYGEGIGSAQPWIIVVGGFGAGCYVAVCYIYWVAAYFELQASMATAVRTALPGAEEHEPTQLRGAARVSSFFRTQVSILQFNATDFCFWVPLLILLGYPGVLVLLLAVSQAATLVKKMIQRSMAMAALDRLREQSERL